MTAKDPQFGLWTNLPDEQIDRGKRPAVNPEEETLVERVSGAECPKCHYSSELQVDGSDFYCGYCDVSGVIVKQENGPPIYKIETDLERKARLAGE